MDAVLDALNNLVEVLDALEQHMTIIEQRAALIRRRREAQALHAEGMPMAQIGALFGVSRQRIADFVNASGADADTIS